MRMLADRDKAFSPTRSVEEARIFNQNVKETLLPRDDEDERSRIAADHLKQDLLVENEMDAELGNEQDAEYSFQPAERVGHKKNLTKKQRELAKKGIAKPATTAATERTTSAATKSEEGAPTLSQSSSGDKKKEKQAAPKPVPPRSVEEARILNHARMYGVPRGVTRREFLRHMKKTDKMNDSLEKAIANHCNRGGTGSRKKRRRLAVDESASDHEPPGRSWDSESDISDSAHKNTPESEDHDEDAHPMLKKKTETEMTDMQRKGGRSRTWSAGVVLETMNMIIAKAKKRSLNKKVLGATSAKKVIVTKGLGTTSTPHPEAAEAPPRSPAILPVLSSTSLSADSDMSTCRPKLTIKPGGTNFSTHWKVIVELKPDRNPPEKPDDEGAQPQSKKVKVEPPPQQDPQDNLDKDFRIVFDSWDVGWRSFCAAMVTTSAEFEWLLDQKRLREGTPKGYESGNYENIFTAEEVKSLLQQFDENVEWNKEGTGRFLDYSAK
eukprot:g5015.t1